MEASTEIAKNIQNIQKNRALPHKSRWIALGLRLGLWLGGTALAVTIAPWLWQGFAPFLLALWVARLLQPVVGRCAQSRGVSPRVVVGFFLFFAMISATALAWLVVPALVAELISLGENWESLFLSGETALKNLESMLLSGKPSASPLLSTVGQALLTGLEQLVAGGLQSLVALVGAQAKKLPAWGISAFVFFMATYFLSVDYPKLAKGWANSSKTLCPPWLHRWGAQVGHSAGRAFGGYLKAQVVLSAGVFALLLGGFWWLQLKFALLLAVVIALLDFIPMIGAGLVLLPWAGVVFFTGDASLGWKILAIWLATALFRRLAEPKIIGQQTGLSSLLTLVSIYGGFQWAGVLGMIFAPILVLIALNLWEMGLFAPLKEDVLWALGEISALLGASPPTR